MQRVVIMQCLPNHDRTGVSVPHHLAHERVKGRRVLQHVVIINLLRLRTPRDESRLSGEFILAETLVQNGTTGGNDTNGRMYTSQH